MNREQIEKYINEYGRDVYSFCTYLMRSREDADDLYQQTFLVAMQKNELDDDKNPKAYLISIATNIWNNHKRKYLWRKKKADIVYLQSEDMADIADDGISTLDTIVKMDEYETVRKLVDKLPEKMKIVILMHYMENMSVDEITKALKIPTGTVKSRMHQAKSRLRERNIAPDAANSIKLKNTNNVRDYTNVSGYEFTLVDEITEAEEGVITTTFVMIAYDDYYGYISFDNLSDEEIKSILDTVIIL